MSDEETRMRRLQLFLTGLAFLAASATTVAQPQDPALATAAKIDRHMAAGWDKGKIKPAAPADDAEFLRRVYVQLAGRIPSVSEGRAFLRDTAPDKRLRVV